MTFLSPGKDRIEPLPLDVAHDDSVKAAAELVREKYGGESSLYGIVNNAGVGFQSLRSKETTVGCWVGRSFWKGLRLPPRSLRSFSSCVWMNVPAFRAVLRWGSF